MGQLIGMTENLKKIQKLSTQHYDSFDDLIASYLSAGIEIFQMETGIVSHITEDKHYIVKDVITPLDVIGPGAIFELQDTYCREVYKTKRVIGLPHVGKIKEMQGHPVYQNLKLEAYISAPIFVNHQLYGTFNFTSVTPRAYGFSEHEMDLISLMANAIGNFILLQEKEQSLIQVNERLKELVGHVSHDLRNPLGMISNLAMLLNKRTDMLEERRDEFLGYIKTNADRCLELVNTILDIAALGSGKITLVKTTFNLVNIIEESIRSFELLALERSILFDIHISEGLNLNADEARLLQAFNNLIGNAAKYASEQSTIHLNAEKVGKHIIIEIRNDIDEQRMSPEPTKYSSKSIGFGLEITKEVLACHQADLSITKEAGEFVVRIALPS